MRYINKNFGSFFNVIKDEKLFVIYIPYIDNKILKEFNITDSYIKFNGKEYICINNTNKYFYYIDYLCNKLDINDKITYLRNLYKILMELIKLNIQEVYLINKSYIKNNLIKYNKHIYINKKDIYKVYISINQFLLPSKIKVVNDDYISLSFVSVFKELKDKGLLYNIEEKQKLINKKIWNNNLNKFDPIKSNCFYKENQEYEEIYVNYLFVDIGDLILEYNNEFIKIEESQLINEYLIENGKNIDGEFLLNQIINNVI